jgi:hypothetical protein
MRVLSRGRACVFATTAALELTFVSRMGTTDACRYARAAAAARRPSQSCPSTKCARRRTSTRCSSSARSSAPSTCATRNMQRATCNMQRASTRALASVSARTHRAVVAALLQSHAMHSCVCNAAQTAIKMRGLGTLDVFRAFDSNRDGLLSCSELYGGLVWLGLRVKPPDVHSIVRYVDKSKDGRIRYVVRPTAARGACAGVSAVARAADWGRKPIRAHRHAPMRRTSTRLSAMPTTTGAHWPRPFRSPVRTKRRACPTADCYARVVATRWDGMAPRRPAAALGAAGVPGCSEQSALRSVGQGGGLASPQG